MKHAPDKYKHLDTAQDYETWEEYYYYLRGQNTEQVIRKALANRFDELDRVKNRMIITSLVLISVTLFLLKDAFL